MGFLAKRRENSGDLVYWKYLQALDLSVSEIRMIEFTQAHSCDSFTCLVF